MVVTYAELKEKKGIVNNFKGSCPRLASAMAARYFAL
jgi:hypothetical protein